MPERLEGTERPTTEADRQERKKQAIELCVFLLLVLPAMVISLFVADRNSLGFTTTAAAAISHNIALVSLIVYFLWRNGEPFTRIGWTFSNPEREISAGLWLYLLLFFAISILETALINAGLPPPPKSLPPFLAAKGAVGYALAFILVVVVAVAEETIFRGYLILRLADVTRSKSAAVAVSTLIFTMGHSYEGVMGMSVVAFIGFALSLVYVWRKSLIAPIVMHFLQDFANLVLMPLLKQG